MIGTIIEWVAGPLGVAAGAVLAILAAWAKGKRDGRQKAARDAERAYRETRERMDAVERSGDAVRDAEWLRERGQR